MKTLNALLNKNNEKSGIENFANFSIENNEMKSILGGTTPNPILLFWLDDDDQE